MKIKWAGVSLSLSLLLAGCNDNVGKLKPLSMEEVMGSRLANLSVRKRRYAL